MQTNFHAQLNSLIALAIGTLRQRISTHGQPSKFDAEIQVLRIVPKTYYLQNIEGSVLELYHDGFHHANGEAYPFSAMHPARLLQLIDEVLTN
jgi:hypothetical protein